MTTSDDLRAMTEQTRARLRLAEVLRLEQRLITDQTARRVEASRRLLERDVHGTRPQALTDRPAPGPVRGGARGEPGHV